jgi:hypothetical protein
MSLPRPPYMRNVPRNIRPRPRGEGLSVQAIANRLNEKGLPIPEPTTLAEYIEAT